MMGSIVFILSAVTSLACAGLLLRAYIASKTRILMWSALCFAGLSLNNVILVVDLLLVPHTDFSTIRLIIADVSLAVLTLGLAWEAR